MQKYFSRQAIPATCLIKAVAREALFRCADFVLEMLERRELADHRSEQGGVMDRGGANRKHRRYPKTAILNAPL